MASSPSRSPALDAIGASAPGLLASTATSPAASGEDLPAAPSCSAGEAAAQDCEPVPDPQEVDAAPRELAEDFEAFAPFAAEKMLLFGS